MPDVEFLLGGCYRVAVYPSGGGDAGPVRLTKDLVRWMVGRTHSVLPRMVDPDRPNANALRWPHPLTHEILKARPADFDFRAVETAATDVPCGLDQPGGESPAQADDSALKSVGMAIRGLEHFTAADRTRQALRSSESAHSGRDHEGRLPWSHPEV